MNIRYIKSLSVCVIIVANIALYVSCFLEGDIYAFLAGKRNTYTEIEMVLIPAGTFTVGSTNTAVTMSGFYLGKYEVTQGQYQAIMGSNPSYFSSNPMVGEIQGNRPVETVSWYDAIVFCNRLSMVKGLTPAYSINGSTNPDSWGAVPISNNSTWNAVQIVSGSTGYRLPTEAQWEYACRAGSISTVMVTTNTGWYSSNSNGKTHEVGLKNVNGWGLYDMLGNVYELCWDWALGTYPSGTENPMGSSSGDSRMNRGGFFDSSNATSANRPTGSPPHRRIQYEGFRLSRPIAE